MKPSFADPPESFISPSDIGQSYVRLAILSALAIWAFIEEDPQSSSEVISNPVLISFTLYIAYSILFLLLSYRWARRPPHWAGWFHVKRIIGLLGDLVCCALYLFLAGEYSLAIYPVYVTIIVGYGLRYGFRYLFLAIGVALVTFTAAAFHSPLFEEFESLMIGFYLGLILIPGYAAVLLKKYQDLLRRLSEVNAARARFIANMSHELRTPLHAIIGNAEVIGGRLAQLERTDPSLAQLSSSARMISEASEHLRTLVDGVLDIASNDAGMFVLGEPGAIDLYRLTQSAIGITKPDSRKKNLQMRWYIDPDVPRTVETWEQHLKAVLINTIGNAVKYTATGSVSVLVRCLESGDKNDSSLVEFRIADTGVGIPSSRLKTIYEPFVIGDDSRARRFEGTGLGLTITKQYLDEMGGKIDIRSDEGVGTTVAIEVPMTVMNNPLPEGSRRAVLVSPKKARNDVREWLQVHHFSTELIEWDGEKPGADIDAGQSEITFIDASYGKQVASIADHIAATCENTLVVLIGDRVPEGVDLPGSFVTRVEPGNGVHLQNLYSLIDREEIAEVHPANTGFAILVVDDNETNLQSAEIALESFGHTVRTVSSGREALVVMREEQFDLAFIDMHMPGFSGLDVAKAYAAESKSQLPIVMLTADVTKAASTDAEIPEIAGFLTKPIRPSELQLAVERYVREGSNRTASGSAGSHSQVSNVMASPSFSKENYLELLNSGVGAWKIDGLVQKFVDDANGIVDQLQRSAEAGAATRVKRLLHKLKGSAAAMHIDGLLVIVGRYQEISEESLCKVIAEESHVLKRAITTNADEIRRFVHELDR
jgi:two-component system, sensor histidine kinase RpfC